MAMANVDVLHNMQNTTQQLSLLPLSQRQMQQRLGQVYCRNDKNSHNKQQKPVLNIQGGPKIKLFLRTDNFAMVNGKKACNRLCLKFQNFV